MIKLILKEKVLILLIVFNMINTIAYIIGGTLINLKYLTLFLTVLVILFSKHNNTLPIIFYLHCNSALYDDVGFSYIFNISIGIILFKEIIVYKTKLNKDSTLLVLLIFLYNLILVLFNNLFSLYGFLSMFSWTGSYFLLNIYSESKKINFNKIYLYFFVGFIMSCIYAIAIPIKMWGFNIPSAYRFIGLLRDPNYYAFDALFLIFTARTFSKSVKKNPIIYMIVISILGVLSVSKMFIILLVFGIILYFVLNFNKLRINPYKIVLFFIILLIITYLVYNSNFIDLIISKYSYRTGTTSILTGRDKIQSFYISYIFNNPLVLLFGNSTNYSAVSNIGNYLGEYFNQMVAHSTYLDLILSWGMFSSIYLYYIYKVIKKSCRKQPKKMTSDSKILIIISILGMFSLSYLQADVFALLILYIILASKNRKDDEKYE